MPIDYRPTVFLPRSDFAMKAGLSKLEPQLLERWRRMGLFARLRQASRGRPKFTLHDGPPYANANIHIGHAVNKILKDVVNRSQQMLGRDANYVPGWDCHGLPIEWKIEERYRAEGRDKDQVPIVEFRRECREFAQHWIGVQRDEFRRLGVEGDWDHPYTTMDFAAEAQIVREVMAFADNGLLFRGSKPVLWSVVEKTALAEAEIEYQNFVSDQVWVKFPLAKAAGDLAGAAIVIWTTTPWTIPGNRAISYSARIAYGLYEVTAAPDGNWTKAGEKLLMADALAEAVFKQARVTSFRRLRDVSGGDLERLTCAHPLKALGYNFTVPLLEGGHVTDDAGTGFVHTAPGHGRDDFDVWTASARKLAPRGIDTEIPYTVDDDGFFTAAAPGFAGKRVITDKGTKGDANEAVIAALLAAQALVARSRLEHEYPHSWRSKKPLIFRNTPQWFIAMDKDIAGPGDTLRARALTAIRETRWVPPQGENRIIGMIESKPDWVISRQRAWGVPIAVFVHRQNGAVLRDPQVNDAIVKAVLAEGSDAWFASPPERFLGSKYRAADYEQVKDILDVWFESGSTHAFVLEKRPDLGWPAALYLEGSDQHRGWFHSSLLESCGTRGRAPYDAVLTHGFALDPEGRKMSKSLGNVVAPQTVADQHGADILRLWVVGCDYSEDLRIGPDILKSEVDNYRRFRNTLRYLLGNLADWRESERLPAADMPELERFVLHRLAAVDRVVRAACADFDFHRIYVALHAFCSADLSAFYFDIRKDALYCDPPTALRRRAARTVLDQAFMCLTAWLAPILCFTAEEAWLARFPGDDSSVHLRTFPDIPASWSDPALAAKWERVRDIRRVVTGALELERAAKRLGSSLQAHPTVYVGADDAALLKGIDMAEACITSGITVTVGQGPQGAFALPEVKGVAAVAGLAAGEKCQRCWQVLPEVGQGPDKAPVCRRCDAAVAASAA
jgi:isoleucyl-tRNA synthetase